LSFSLTPFLISYLSAKTCYFGVGGGSQDFASFVKRRGIFSVETVKQFTEGTSRGILFAAAVFIFQR
jgi:hypothetical protein